MVSAAVLGTTVSSVQAEGRFGHTIPGGDLEDVIARAQAMTPPADKKWIEVSGQVTAQPLTPNAPQFPYMYQRAQKGAEDAFGNTAKENVTWTATNGVTLTFPDDCALIAREDPYGMEESLYYGDGVHYIYSRNQYSNRYEPNTPQWWAAKELEYKQWKMGYRVLANSGAFVIAPPPVATVEHFQKEVSKDTTYRNYIDKMEFYTQYRELGTFYLSGHYDGSVGPAVPFATLIANENQVVTFHRTTDPSAIKFELLKTADVPENSGYHYKLEFWNNPDPLDWNILYNTLKRITPDADAVYQEIYRQTYSDNPTFPDWNTWVPVGNETCVATALCRHYANLQFFIKAKDLNPGADGSEIAENSCALDTRYERFVWE